jgi:hypothetical protein
MTTNSVFAINSKYNVKFHIFVYWIIDKLMKKINYHISNNEKFTRNSDLNKTNLVISKPHLLIILLLQHQVYFHSKN